MSVNSKMTALADEIRELSGTTGTMGLDTMINHVDEANIGVATEADLIEQISSLLEGKAAGGEQATPVISVNSTNGLIIATAGTKTSTHQLAFQTAKTITPSTASQIAVSSGYYTGGNITVAGDSNLVAGNIKNGVSIFGVNGTLIEGSNGSGEQTEWSANEDAIISRTISNYTNDRVTSIGNSAFAGCSSLTSVNFPACTTIGDGAFHNCENLRTISFPICTSVGYYAFSWCKNLKTVSLPVCVSIGSYAFAGCSSLTSISLPVCTTIGGEAFARCYSLTSVDFPSCTNIIYSTFVRCSKLTTVNLPACTSIAIQAFNYCENLKAVSLPVCTTIGSYAFSDCTSLTTVSFPACTHISNYAFAYCFNLKSLYLTGSSLCTLSHSNAFYSTPIGGYSASAGTYGSIYVPASLLTSYQTATNWTYFSSRFVGI